MQIKTNKNYMIAFWIVMALIGTGITIFSSMKLNDEWDKGKDLKATHLLPQNLLMDFELEVELDENIKDIILKKVKEKTNFIDANFEDFNEIDLSTFFNEKGYDKNPILKKIIHSIVKFIGYLRILELVGFAHQRIKTHDLALQRKKMK